jgi:methyl-accepting chemotaxis protein
MNALHNLNLVYRFAVLIVCMVIGFASYGLWSFKTLNDLKVNGPLYQRIVQGKDLVADILPPPEYILESYLVTLQLATSEPSEHAALIKRLEVLKSEYDSRHDYWQQQGLEARLATPLLNQAHPAAIRFYQLSFNDFIPALQQGNDNAAIQALSTMKQAYASHRQAIDEVVAAANDRVKEDETTAAERIAGDSWLMFAVLALSIALTAAIALLISRSVTGPLGNMQRMMGQIQHDSDFTRRITVTNNDEIGATAQTFNELITSLQDTLLHVLNNADQVSHAAHALSASSQQVTTSSSQQQLATASIASEVEEVNASIHSISQSAREALEISRKSGDLSNQGGNIIHNAATAMMQIAETVQETSNTIEALGQQSKEISSVVQVIKEVADQTNLLALNAAIEAARAGEQGRGFAVVADEVRNLAKRTTKATEEISHMIKTMQNLTQVAIASMGATVSKADGGAVIATQAGDAINEIKLGSSQVVDVVNDISAALNEQNNANNAVASHVEEVADMTQENNKAANQAAHAAMHLERLAGDMRAIVGQFKL